GGEWRDGLGMVDARRATVEANHRRKGWLEPGVAAFALQRLHERRLLATDVGTGTGRNRHLEVEAAAQNAVPDVACRTRLCHRALHLSPRVGQLAADIDEGMAHLGRIGGDDDPLNQQVRVQLHQHTILEGAWLTLVAVDDEVAWPGAGRREEAPLHAGGEAGATTAAQTRMLDLLHQLLRREV